MLVPEHISAGYILLSFAASFAACFFSTLSGGGAGLILLPILIFLDLPFINALASHKLTVGFIGFGAALRYYREGIIDKKVFWWTSLIGIPFVILGTISAAAISADIMRDTLGAVIIIMVLIYALKSSSSNHHQPVELKGKVLIIASLCMLPVAFYSGWLSAGSGIFTTFIYLYLLRYDQLHATAMTIVANGIFWNGVGAIAHCSMGHIIWPLAPGLIAGAFLGSYCGASLGITKGNRFLKVMFLISAFATGVIMLW
jgi:uncharacterized membrane protein YfcA